MITLHRNPKSWVSSLMLRIKPNKNKLTDQPMQTQEKKYNKRKINKQQLKNRKTDKENGLLKPITCMAMPWDKQITRTSQSKAMQNTEEDELKLISCWLSQKCYIFQTVTNELQILGLSHVRFYLYFRFYFILISTAIAIAIALHLKFSLKKCPVYEVGTPPVNHPSLLLMVFTWKQFPMDYVFKCKSS